MRLPRKDRWPDGRANLHDIESDGVAKFVPTFAVGIMACAHSINVGLFHQADVAEHQFFGHHLTRLRIHLMTVHAAKPSGNTIDKQLSVFDFHRAETHLSRYFLHRLVKRILEQQFECIEIRGFGSPFLWVLNRCGKPSPPGIAALRCAVVEDGALGIEVKHSVSGPTPALPA